MKRFRERDRALTGLVGVVVVTVLVVGALNFPSLPLIHDNATYQADFANAGGLQTGDVVTIDGVKVGSITAMALEGDQVRVTFTASGTTLGSGSSAAAEVLSPVGTEYLQVSPSGSGSLQGPIPLSRTSVPYNLVTALSGLGSEIRQYNIPQLEKALGVGSAGLQRNQPQGDDQRLPGSGRHLSGDRQRGAGPGHDRLAGGEAQRRPLAAEPTALQPLRTERPGAVRPAAAASGHQPAPHGNRAR